MIVALLGMAALAGPDNHGEIWLEAGAEARVSDGWSIGATQNYRTSTGSQGVREFLTDVSAEARVADAWRLGMAYRFGTKADDGRDRFAHRVLVEGRAKAEVGRLRLDWRERYQVRLPTADDGLRHVVRSRVRGSLDLDIPFMPRVAVEPFLALGDGDGNGKGVGLDKVRFTLGIRYRRKPFDVGLSYRLEEPVRDRTDARLHVLSLGITWKGDARREDEPDEPSDEGGEVLPR